MAEQTVELAPGESKVISFEAVPKEAKVYHVSVNGLTASFKAIAAPLPRLYGVVTNAETGQPLAGVKIVLLLMPEGIEIATIYTDDKGYYSTEGFGSLQITFSKDGFEPLARTVGVPQIGSVELNVELTPTPLLTAGEILKRKMISPDYWDAPEYWGCEIGIPLGGCALTRAAMFGCATEEQLHSLYVRTYVSVLKGTPHRYKSDEELRAMAETFYETRIGIYFLE